MITDLRQANLQTLIAATPFSLEECEVALSLCGDRVFRAHTLLTQIAESGVSVTFIDGVEEGE